MVIMDLPLELIDTICNLIDLKLLRELYGVITEYIFISLNRKRLEKYWEKKGIRKLIQNNDFQGIKYLVQDGGIDLNKEEENNSIFPFPIITAIYEGNLEMVKYLISLGANHEIGRFQSTWDHNEEVKITNNYYPLKCACDSNNLEIMKYFIEDLGVNISILDDYSIDFGSGHGYLEMVKYLYSLGLKITVDALYWASGEGRLDIVKYLVSVGDFTRDNIIEGIYEGYRGGHLDIVQFLAFTEGIDVDSKDPCKNPINYEEINRWTIVACGQGKLDMLKNLLFHGADVKSDIYPLRFAIKNGQIEIIKYLIEQGADITFEIWLTLKIVVDRGYLNLLKYLVSLGIDVKLKNNQAIKDACENGRMEMVKYLVEQGADFRVNNDLPIKLASEYDQVEIVRYLHSLGADIHKGPIKIASRSWALNVVKYLVGQGVSIRGCREICKMSPNSGRYVDDFVKNPVLGYLENLKKKGK